MKYISIIHPKWGKTIIQVSPHVPHNELLETLGNPPCLGAAFAVLPETIFPKPIGQSQSLGKSPSMHDAFLLAQGYEMTRLQNETAPLFNQNQNN